MRFCNEAVEKMCKIIEKQRTKFEGQVLPLKKCTVFCFIWLCNLWDNKVCSQPTFLYFMMQF